MLALQKEHAEGRQLKKAVYREQTLDSWTASL